MVHRGWATEGRRVLMRVVTILITRCKAAGQAGSLKGSSSQQNSGLRRANSKHGVFQHPLAKWKMGAGNVQWLRQESAEGISASCHLSPFSGARAQAGNSISVRKHGQLYGWPGVGQHLY